MANRYSKATRPHHPLPRSLALLCSTLLAFCFSFPMAAATYLTGQIEDGESQKIEMPRLPGTWVRNIAWMAPEGQMVEAGEVVLTLDPGDLRSQEETLAIARDEHRQNAEAQLSENAVAIIDARIAMFRAESALKIAEINAEIPVEAITGLIYEQNQLNFENAKNAYIRAKTALANVESQREDMIPVHQMGVEQGDANYARIREALDRTEMRANKAGLMIYGENPMTGEKIYPGESLPPSTVLAMIANQSSLVFRFWVHEADIKNIQDEMPLQVTADAIPGKTVAARVTWMSKQASTRDNWSEGGYFELLAEPVDLLPEGFIAGMSIMAILED